MNINVNVKTNEEAQEIFDFVNRIGRVVDNNKSKTFGECLEDADLDVRLQHDYIIKLLEETDGFQDDTFRKLQERLIDRELANLLDYADEVERMDEAIGILDERLDRYNDKYSILIDMLSAIQDEVMR